MVDEVTVEQVLSSGFFVFPILITLPLFLHIHPSPSPELCVSPGQAAHCYIPGF
jgi:hypothetical protein